MYEIRTDPRSGAHASATQATNSYGSHARSAGAVAILRALGRELRGVVAVARRTRGFMWSMYGMVLLVAASVGALPLGWLALLLQVAGFLLVALFIVFPGIIAHGIRADDAWEMLRRDSADAVTYLPVLVAFFSVPFYLLAQAVLFRRIFLQLPGILTGSTWGDAWRLSLDNLLFTELFLDVFDIFGLGLAAEPPHLAGRVIVFFTRLLLSIGFVRIAIGLLRAAFYGAHGMGRGSDPLGALETAVGERDAVLAGHLGRELTNDIRGTIDLLLEQHRDPARRDEALPALRALDDWVKPYLDDRILFGDPRADELEAVLEDMRTRTVPDPPPPPRRIALAGLAVMATTATLATSVRAPAIIGFPLGAVCMLLLAWLLTVPRTSYEWGMERGMLPFVSLWALPRATLAWSATVAVAFVLVAWSTLLHAAALWPDAFASVQGDIDGGSMLGFIAASVLRVQAFMSIPEVFGIGEAAIEQRPWLGSLLTLTLRTGLNLGFVAVVLTGFTLRRDREDLTGLVSVPDDLALRVEARRGGRYAPEMLIYHSLKIQFRLWDALDAADDADVQDALVDSGAFEWCAARPSLGEASTAERLRSHCLVMESRHRGGSRATAWRRELEDACEAGDWPPLIRSQVLARRGAMAARDDDVDTAGRLFAESYALLAERPDVMDESAARETAAVWVRSVIRAIAVMPAAAIHAGVADPLVDRAADLLADLVRENAERFTIDALRIGGQRALLVARSRGFDDGLHELESVAEQALALPATHPWRAVMLIQLLGWVGGIAELRQSTPERIVADAPAADPVVALEDRLSSALGLESESWGAADLAVHAADGRLGEALLGQVQMLISTLSPTPATYAAAMLTADIFQARLDAGILEARAYAFSVRVLAAMIAYRLGWYDETVTAGKDVSRLMKDLRAPGNHDLLARVHVVSAFAARALGRETEAIEHARQARDLYGRIANSDGEGATAAAAAGLAQLDEFGPLDA